MPLFYSANVGKIFNIIAVQMQIIKPNRNKIIAADLLKVRKEVMTSSTPNIYMVTIIPV